MDTTQAHDLDQQIARLEAQLGQLKAQRAQQLGRKPKPLDGIRILDMSRTTVNVFGDLTAAVYVAKSEGVWSPKSLPAV